MILTALNRRSIANGRGGTPYMWFTPTADPLSALQSARKRTSAAGKPVVWVIDQLEKLFTSTSDEAARMAFLDAITGTDAGDGAPVVSS